MSSFSSLGIGVSALLTSQRAVEVAAHNVANAGTPGFTRQRLETQTATPTTGTLGVRGDGQRGMGVTVLGVERLRDRLSDVTLRNASAQHGKAAAEATSLSRVEDALGQYGDGVPQLFSRFLSSFDQLTLTPKDPAARTSALFAGRAVADGLKATGEGLDQVRGEIGQRMVDTASELNGLLQTVASLNGSIRDAEIDLGSPNDLRDRRDAALDRIATLSGATATLRADGMVQVRLGDSLLVDGPEVTPVEVDPAAEPPVVTPGEELSGTLGGLLRTAAVDLPQRRAQLDELAAGIAAAVNAVHEAHVGLDGTGGRPFFSGTTAADLEVVADEQTLATSRAGAAADGDGALAMSALRTRNVPELGGATVAEALRSFSTQIGQAAADATRSESTASSALLGATQVRDSLNGVNVDEEMVDLVKFQHAYSAASRVITVVDEMLDRIINQMGR